MTANQAFLEAAGLTPEQERRLVKAFQKLVALQDFKIRERAWTIGRQATAEHRANDALGECQLAVDPDLFFAWRAQGWRPNDKSDVRYLLKRHPECAVRSRGTRPQVGYTRPAGIAEPSTNSTRSVKYYRNYGVIDGAKH